MQKSSFIYNLLFLFIVIYSFSSCKFEYIEFKNIEDFKIETINLHEISGTITTEISNPNRFKIKITEYHILISFNNLYFSSFDTNAEIVIPANSNNLHDIPFKLAIESQLLSLKTLKAINEIIANESAEMSITGFLKVKTALISKKIPLNKKTVVNFKKNN